MEKKMENEMEMRVRWGFIRIRALYELLSKLLKGGVYGGLYRGLLKALLRGILGVETIAHIP